MRRSRRAADALETILDAIPPASGAVVMGTGIVSIALSLDGQETLSRVLLALDAAVWVILAILLPARALRDRARFRRDLRTPAAFTAVAGTAVLGTRLTAGSCGHPPARSVCSRTSCSSFGR
jgi:tellurite resistance protein TehA-like permease